MSAEQLITKHLDIWTSAHKTRSSAGRGSSSKLDLYGIKKLRELILELAVRGKLVPQDPSDEPASELLKKIATEKTQLIKEGKIKNEKPLPAITDVEKKFELPDGWRWSRLGNISEQIHYGYTASSNAELSEVRLLRITDIQDDKVDWSSVPGCEIESDKVSQYELQNQDILIARTGGTIGKSYLVKEINVRSVFASYLIRVKHIGHFSAEYKKTYLGSQLYWSQLYSKSMGTGQPNVNGEALKSLVVSIPPLQEQKRIVAKVDELMAFCDQLEQAQSNNIAAHAQLVKSLLTTLTNSKDHQELQANWQRIAEHFDTLFTTEDSIDQLKQTILQLAVMGKLVPQDPNDEPASELLKKIAAEKAQLIKEGKIKKEKPLPAITDEEKPFALPKGWEWTKFGWIAEFINGDRGKNYPNVSEYVEQGIAWINTGHIEPNGTLTVADMNYITRDKFDSLRGGKIQNGDLVYCLRGATFGKTAFVTPYSEGAIASSLMIIRPYIIEINSFIYRYLISNIGRSQIFRFDNGSAQPNLSASNVMLYVFPLPPLEEQHRIVAKVQELTALCDLLKAEIKSIQNTELRFADALVEQAVS